jgi:23S rRNA pseudouridine1911/1915/1917 synthase
MSARSLSVLYLDESLLIVDKPAGQVMHEGPGHTYDTTLTCKLLERFPELSVIGESGQPGMVHRIDKDTGGLVIVGRTQSAYLNLKEQIVTRSLKRLYLACVVRPPSAGGVWHDVLGRSGRQKMRVVRSYTPGADVVCDPSRFEKRAALAARVIAAKNGIGIIEYALDTGVQHQIRCQSSARGCPVIGDKLYGRRNCHALSDEYGMLLYAYCLSFVHPVSGERVDVVRYPPWIEGCCSIMGVSLQELDIKPQVGDVVYL